MHKILPGLLVLTQCRITDAPVEDAGVFILLPLQRFREINRSIFKLSHGQTSQSTVVICTHCNAACIDLHIVDVNIHIHIALCLDIQFITANGGAGRLGQAAAGINLYFTVVTVGNDVTENSIAFQIDTHVVTCAAEAVRG